MRRLAALLTVLGLVFAIGSGAPAGASSVVPLNGFGSSWAGPAIEQWGRAAAADHGIQITFTPNGSAQGRQLYIEDQADFAASDIAFLTTPDPFNGGTESVGEAYSYVPIVAGGTAFMYNLVVGGKKITNLRLSGLTIARIFTGQITNWDDPAITHDYGAQLPNQPITVVTRSDGSGASYQFTRWMSKEYSSIWTPFCQHEGGTGACGPTEFYPAFGTSQQKNGSDQVASFISSSIGEGSIGYDEYAYAVQDHINVVKLLNAAGYYSLPTASNVAIALQQAQIDYNQNDVTYLMQNLDNVYTYNDPRTYPLSSYSYLIVPRNSRVINGVKYGPPAEFNTNKGYTLTTWLNDVLCTDQQTAGSLGYSPLPKPLVQGGFNEFQYVPGSIPTPDTQQLNGCNNPTYSNGVNHLIVGAPYPSPCDYKTAPLNCTVVNGHATAGGSGSNGSGNNGSGANGNGTGNPTGTGGPTATNTTSTNGNSLSNLFGSGNGGNGANGSGNNVSGSAVDVANRMDQQWLFATLTALEILGAIAAPALIGIWLQRRRRPGAGAP